MTRLPQPDNRFYVGKGGQGKSTLARSHARALGRVIVHDPNAEPEWAAGALIVSTQADLARELIAHAGRRVRLCWRGHLIYGDAAFEIANRAAWAAGDVLSLWDELDQFTTAADLPKFARALVHQGRHRGCRAWGIARRPAMVPRKFTSNVQRVCAFRVTEPLDVRYLAGVIGTGAATVLPTLPDFSFLDWSETADFRVVRG